MNINLGTLDFLSPSDHPELLAPPVATNLSALSGAEGVGVAAIDASLSDTAAFCEHYGVAMEQAANCVIVEGKRGENRTLAAVMILGSTRADINKVVKKELDVRKVSFAPMEMAVEKSGMEYGAITPVGLPEEWPILIDKKVADSEYVIIGSGIRGSKLAVTGEFLANLPGAKVIEGLAS